MTETTMTMVIAVAFFAVLVILLVKKMILEPIAERKQQIGEEQTQAKTRKGRNQFNRVPPDQQRLNQAKEAFANATSPIQLLYGEQEVTLLGEIVSAFNMSAYAHTSDITAEIKYQEYPEGRYAVTILGQSPPRFFSTYLLAAFPIMKNTFQQVHFMPATGDFEGTLDTVKDWLNKHGCEEAFSVR